MGFSAASALHVALLAIAATVAVAQPAPTSPKATAFEELEAARQLWAAGGSDNYGMIFQRSALFFEPFFKPVKVIVMGGVVTQVVLEESGAAPEGPNAERISTVVEVFDIIADSLNDPVAVVTVTYDPYWGYPAKVIISADPSTNIQDFGSSYNIDVPWVLPPTPPGGRSGPPPAPTTAEELANARALWAKEGSGDYVMRFRRGALFFEPFFEPVIVTVKGGLVTKVVLEESGAAPKGPNAEGILTVMEVFDLIADSLNDPVAVVTVTYDPLTGVPNDVDISADPSANIQDFGSNYDIDILELLPPVTTGGAKGDNDDDEQDDE